MSQLTKPQCRLATVASILGILQGISWFVMSLICIIQYLNSPDNVPEQPAIDSPYMERLSYNIYLYLLFANGGSSTNILNPDSFHIFMWIYLIADIFLFLLSWFQLRVINVNGHNPKNIMRSWAGITFFISCIDFILVVLIGVDYNKTCQNTALVFFDIDCTNVYIPVLVIAARGFILWIFNVAFVYVVYRIVKTIKSGKNRHNKLLGTNPRIPRATYQSPISTLQKPEMENGSNFWGNSSNPTSTMGRPLSYNPSTPSYNYPSQQRAFSGY